MERYTKVVRVTGMERSIVVLMVTIFAGLVVLPLASRASFSLPGRANSGTVEAGLTATAVVLAETTVISAGQDANCVAGDNTVHCWGSGLYGLLGHGGALQAVSGLSGDAVEITVGSGFACARLQIADGSFEVACWGANWGGTLGDGATEASALPIRVAGLAGKTTHLSAGLAHVCATVNGEARCWGSNWYGELGIGEAGAPVTTPVGVPGVADLAVQKVVAGYRHSCALLIDGSVRCWGDGSSGQVGNGDNRAENATPVDVHGLAGRVVDVTAGGEHSCALLQDGRVQCWGANWWGQLGEGTTTLRSVPVFARIDEVTTISAGGGHTCAVKRTGAAYCWGDNANGQLGAGDEADRLEPTPVVGFTSSVAAIAAGSRQTCALLDDGQAQCWGLNVR